LQYTAAVSRTESEPATAIARLPALDGLRGIAILLVLSHHYGVIAGFPGPQQIAAGRLIERLCYAGWAGVDLFFVLSGFLISSILLATRDTRSYFKTFYVRRVLRIFPLYFGTLVLGLVILPRVAPLPASFMGQAGEHAGWLWTYTTNIGLALGAVSTFGVFDLYWSLAIEEQFYFVWPGLVRLTRTRTLAITCGVVVLGALAWRAIWIAHGGPWSSVYRFTPTRLDELAMGALVAIAVRDKDVRARLTRVMPAMFPTSLLAFGAMFLRFDPFYPSVRGVEVAGHSVLAVLFACVIFTAATSPVGWLATRLSASWLRAWGRVSYGAYVWHWPLRLALEGPYRRIAWTGAAAHFLQASLFFAVGLAGSYAIAWLSYHAYERHFLKLKRKVSYERTTSSTSIGQRAVTSTG